MANNCAEWTTETYSDSNYPCTVRGGICKWYKFMWEKEGKLHFYSIICNEKHKKGKVEDMNILNIRNFKLKHTKKSAEGITLIALVITIVFPYDEKLKCSNSKGFLLTTI